MTSLGINRDTGKVLSGFAHVEQSVRTILTTLPGTRVMRRTFGSFLTSLLGRENVEPDVIMRVYMAVAVAIALWEPRFRLVNILFENTTTDGIRQGAFSILLVGEYRPRALAGDFTVQSSRQTIIIQGGS